MRRLLPFVVLALASAACASSAPSGEPAASTFATSALSSAAPTPSSTSALPPEPTGSPCLTPDSGDYSFASGDRERSYTIRAPETLLPDAALIVLLHGFSSTPERILQHSELGTAAPRAGAVVVAPLATGEPTSWEIVPPDDPDDPAYAGPNDLGFIIALGQQLLDDYPCLGPVWAAGLSAGSAMAGVYMCSEPDGLVGAALVAALIPAVCEATSVREMLIFHGTDDIVVSYGGGEQAVGEDSVDLPAIEASAAAWAALAGCGDVVTSELAADVELRRYPDCQPAAAVSLHTYIGGNHNWPGGADDQLPTIIQSLPASCVLLERIAGRSDAPAACLKA